MGQFDHFTRVISKPLWPQTVTLYLLIDPRSNTVRYVGASAKPNEQLSKNLYHAKIRTIGPLFDWLRELRASGLRPIVSLVGEVPKYNVKDHLQAFKKNLGFTDPPRRPRGPALK